MINGNLSAMFILCGESVVYGMALIGLLSAGDYSMEHYLSSTTSLVLAQNISML